jgi:hypothetical protein
MPADYDEKRRLGRLLTNSSANINNQSLTEDGFVKANNPGLPKGWAYLNASTVVQASHNVSGAVNNSAGDYQIIWDVDFASINYAVLVSTFDATDTGAAIELAYVREAPAAGSVRIRTVQNDGGSFNDTAFFIAAFGR